VPAELTLRGRVSNRLGIGSRIDAHFGERRIVRELYPANGFRAEAPLVVHLVIDPAMLLRRSVVRPVKVLQLEVPGQTQDSPQFPLVEEADPAHPEPFGPGRQPQVLHRAHGRVLRDLGVALADGTTLQATISGDGKAIDYWFKKSVPTPQTGS